MRTFHIQTTLEILVDETNFTDDDHDGIQMTDNQILDQVEADVKEDFEEFCNNYSPTTTGPVTVTQKS